MAAKTHLGLEINDQSIKYIELSQQKSGFVLGKHGEIKLQEGVIEDGSIRLRPKLLKILTDIQKRGKWKEATVSHLPDQVFLADLLKEAGFKNIYFESAGEAVGRVAVPKKSNETVMVVYFAGGKMDIYAGNRKTMRLLATFNFSSALFDQMRDKEIVYSFIKEKIDEQYISWHTHLDSPLGLTQSKEQKRSKIMKIIVAGGLSTSEDLASYLQKSLRIKTELPNVWQNLFSFERHIPEINFRDSLRYSAAIGLAFRSFEK